MMGLMNLTVIALMLATLYKPVSRELTVLGVFRTPSPAAIAEQAVYRIEDTAHCEDLHEYGGKLFAACEDTPQTRFGWFPPVEVFTQTPQTTGSIHVIDPKTMKSTRLAFENFSGAFVTHGIDVTRDPDNKDAVYIFAVNHLPNPDFYGADTPVGSDTPEARSQVELFHHALGSPSVRHVRSIRHPLIRTPNDILAQSPTSFYVTNDHFYRHGLMRLVEDIIPDAKWSSTVHVRVDSFQSADGESGIDATTALTGLHNNNGLGHGASPDEVVIGSAIDGVMHRATVHESNRSITVRDSISFDTTIDNPSYFRDLHAASPADDRSGYVNAGLTRGIDLLWHISDPNAKDGAMVWYARPSETEPEGWEKRVLFEDDGSLIRTASAAVLVGGEAQGAGERKAWLFVTGFLAESVVAVEVRL